MTTIPPSGSFTSVIDFDSVCNPVLTFSETALKLDTLVGDIEDAVSSSVNRNLRKNPSAPNSEVSTLKIAQKAVAASTYRVLFCPYFLICCRKCVWLPSKLSNRQKMF